MNAAKKTTELLDTLKAACARQFGFNPRRVAAEMRYVGTEGHGKDQVHVFRDAGTHSQIALKLNFATLREKQGDKPHWTEAEKAHYRNTDAQIDAELEAKQAELDWTRNSALYRDHRELLLSHYKDWPGYRRAAGTRAKPRERCSVPCRRRKTHAWRNSPHTCTAAISTILRASCSRLAILNSNRARQTLNTSRSQVRNFTATARKAHCRAPRAARRALPARKLSTWVLAGHCHPLQNQGFPDTTSETSRV